MKPVGLFLVIALLTQLSATAEGATELRGKNCQTAPFFREADVQRNPAELTGFRPVTAFPILLNAIHKPARNGALLHYSVICSFELPTAIKGDQFLYLPGIGENFDIYLNGSKVHSDIHVLAGHLDIYRYTKFINVSLPAASLKPGSNTLFFHIAGYAPMTPLSENFLLGLPFRSGYTISAQRDEGPGSLLLFFLTASYVFFGLYHLFFYLRWREKIYNLHFAVFSLAISGYFLAFSQEAFARIGNTRYLIMASYSCQMIALAFFLLYVQKFFFEEKKLPLSLKISAGVDLLLASTVLAGQDTWQQSLLTFWYFTALPQLLMVFYIIGNAVLHRRPDARLLAASIFVAILMILFDMLDTLVFFSSVRLSQFAYFTVVASLVLIMANRFIKIHHETDRLNHQLSTERNSFSRFVPSQFLENLGKSTALEIRRGDTAEKQMGILFLDIRNFTGIAEKLSPSESLVFLNVFMKKMEQAISQNGGFVDKYIGDGLLALFGSGKDNTTDGGAHAVRAGMQMLSTLSSFGRFEARYGKIQIGIGIHCGSLVMGTLGSKRRLDTTVIGDAVNLASRLEMLTTLYGCGLIMSGDAYASLSEAMKANTRKIDTVKVKGRAQAVEVYEYFGANDAHTAALKRSGYSAYTAAMEAYRSGNFSLAEQEFNRINASESFDSAAAAMAKRCRKLARTGAPANWDGVLPLDKK